MQVEDKLKENRVVVWSRSSPKTSQTDLSFGDNSKTIQFDISKSAQIFQMYTSQYKMYSDWLCF